MTSGPEPIEVLARESLEHYPRLVDDSLHPKSWRFPDYLDRDDIPWLAELKRLYTEQASFPASISPEAGLMLHALIRNMRARLVVEVGTFLGVSTVWIASALEANGRGGLHSFDDFGPMESGPWRDAPLEDREARVLDTLERARLDGRVVLHRGNSADQLAARVEEFVAAGGVQVAFLDGDHSIEGVTADLHAVEPALNTGAYVILHDTNPDQCGGHEGPRHILDNLDEVGRGRYEKCELHLEPLNYGMAVLRRIG